MSVLVLEYDLLGNIASYANNVVKYADEYAASLAKKVKEPVGNLEDGSSANLENASYFVDQKIKALKKKSSDFSGFSSSISNLYETAERVDQDVAVMLSNRQESFLQYHESLRVEGWKADILNWLIDLKNSIPLLNIVADVLSTISTYIDSLRDTIKHWYHCEGGKYYVECVVAVAGAVIAIAIFIATLPASGFVAICAAIGAGIGAANALTNVVTSIQATYAAHNGDPAWAVIYGKRDKFTDVLRQENFGNGTLNRLSHIGATIIDVTEVFCGAVVIVSGIINTVKNLPKSLKGLSNTGRMRLDKRGLSTRFDDLGPGTMGSTDSYGNIKIKRGLKGQDFKETFRHELVHRFFSPKAGPFKNFRAKVGFWGYKNSNILRYTEEAIAEAYGSRNIIKGLRFPIAEGYVKLSDMFKEGAIVGGGIFLGYSYINKLIEGER